MQRLRTSRHVAYGSGGGQLFPAARRACCSHGVTWDWPGGWAVATGVRPRGVWSCCFVLSPPTCRQPVWASLGKRRFASAGHSGLAGHPMVRMSPGLAWSSGDLEGQNVWGVDHRIVKARQVLSAFC
jgi:hypothetical protein